MLLFIMLYEVVLSFEILQYDYSYESYAAILSCGNQFNSVLFIFKIRNGGFF